MQKNLIFNFKKILNSGPWPCLLLNDAKKDDKQTIKSHACVPLSCSQFRLKSEFQPAKQGGLFFFFPSGEEKIFLNKTIYF